MEVIRVAEILPTLERQISRALVEGVGDDWRSMRVSFGVLFVVIATMSSAKARGKRPAASSKVMPKMVTALAALTTPERNTAYMFHGDQFLPAPDDDKENNGGQGAGESAEQDKEEEEGGRLNVKHRADFADPTERDENGKAE